MRLRLVPLLACLFLAGACGLKPGVYVEATGPAGRGGGAAAGDGTGTGTGLEPVDGVTDPAGDGSAGGGGGGGDPAAGGSGGDGGATGGGVAGPGGPSGPAGPGGPTPAAGDRGGLDPARKEIRIGIHAPVTGAAPIQQSSFRNGRQIYWDFVRDKGGFSGGWNVRVFFEDDTFKPSVAVQKCRKMVEQDKVFLLVGGGGAEQITACAKYAASVGVPYLASGVNEAGLEGVATAFSLSATYSQQSPLLAQLAKNVFRGDPVAVIAADSTSFDDAFASANREMRNQGLDIKLSKRIPNSLSQTQALQLAGDLQRSGARTVYFLASPTSFIYTAQAGQSQGYVPQYIGPGITAGLNTVANLGCPGVGTASFLSPFPQMDVIDRIDPDYRPAYDKYAEDGDPDDIGIALWGLSRLLRVMFEAADPNVMSRQSFVRTLESGKEFRGGVFPPVKYGTGPRGHFGGGQVHRLQADCGSRTYRTVATFASSF